MQLSPSALLARTGLRPDAEIVPGWTLFDVGWTRDRSGLRVELASGTTQGGPCVTLVLRPGTDNDLDGPPQRPSLVAAIRQAWAGVLAEARGVVPPTREDLLIPFAPERPAGEMPLPASPDHALITTEIANYQRHCGARPQVVDVGGGDAGLRYPPSETQAELGAMRPVPCEVLERRAHRALIVALGFSIEADGMLRTVPTPRTFRQRATRDGHTPGLLPVLRGIRGAQQGPAWTRSLLAGEFIVGVPRGWTLRLPLVRAPVSTMAHDLGFHCLPLHFVTAGQWERLRGAVARRAGSTAASPSQLTSWLEGPLTNACWDVWAAADAPQEVMGLLATRWTALISELAD